MRLQIKTVSENRVILESLDSKGKQNQRNQTPVTLGNFHKHQDDLTIFKSDELMLNERKFQVDYIMNFL